MPAAKVLVEPGDKPTGKVRTFLVTVTKTVELTLDESVIAQGVDPDGPIYGSSMSGDPMHDTKIVVEHIAFNMVCNGLTLSEIDGYANCPNASATVAPSNWYIELGHEVLPVKAKKRTR
jgi:hypothetical protein